MKFAKSARVLGGAALSGLLFALPTGAKAEILTPAKQAMIYDYDAGEMLFCKACDEPKAPAS